MEIVKVQGVPREMIALRISKEIKDGDYVNLGIGIPTLISNWIEGRDVMLQSEIGMLKTGPLILEGEINQDLINASCQPVQELPGTVYFDIVESFTMIRGGRMNIVSYRRGKWRRWLANVFVPTRTMSLNLQLVREGLAQYSPSHRRSSATTSSRLSLTLPPDLTARLQERARELNTEAKEIARAALESYLAAPTLPAE